MHKYFVLLIGGPIYLLSLLPLGVLYKLTGFFVFLLSRILGYRRSTVLINIARSFPEFKYDKVEKTSKKFYKNLASIAAENIKMISVSEKKVSEMASVNNPQVLNDLYKKSTPVVIVAGHCGNWEMLGFTDLFNKNGTIGFSPEQLYFIYKRQHSEFSDHLAKLMRRWARKEPVLIESKSAARAIIKNKEQPGCYFMFADQAPLPGAKFAVDFLNQETFMINGPEVISRLAACPVVFLELQRERRGRYIIDLHLITENAAETEPGFVTARYAHLLQEAIRKQPDNWLWSHKRWKRGRKENMLKKYKDENEN